MARFNIPPLTRALFVALVALTLLNAVIQPDFRGFRPITRKGNGAPYLSLIPGTSYRYPWTFATSSFVEQNIPGLAVTGLVIFFGGRYLERAYGSAEYAKFILFSTILPNVLSFCIYVFFYMLSKSDRALTATISGGISIQASFLVAFKQLVPEHTVSLFHNVLRMRVKHFPALFLAANTVSGLILGTETAAFLAWLGFLVSWTYLRFYRITPALSIDTGADAPTVKGDASDTFAFAYFFPEPLHSPIAAVADRVWEIALSLRLCSPFSDEDVESGNEQASARAEGGLPTVTGGGRAGSARREEAERRRALALKALDQRLNAATTRGGTSPARSAVNGATNVAEQEKEDGKAVAV